MAQGDQSWGQYLVLTAIALSASAFRWPDLIRDQEGHARWGVLGLQIPTAFAIGVVAHASAPIVQHFWPYAGDDLAFGLAGVLAFLGPLAATRMLDGLLAILKERFGR